MTPHERAIATVQALQKRKKRREDDIHYYEAEKCIRMKIANKTRRSFEVIR
jgi:hypothetical protein